MSEDILETLINETTRRINELADKRNMLIKEGQALSGAIIESQNYLKSLVDKKNTRDKEAAETKEETVSEKT